MTPDPKELREMGEKLERAADILTVQGSRYNGFVTACAYAIIAFADHLDRERWIPVSEQFPERNKDVLISLGPNHLVRIGRWNDDDDWIDTDGEDQTEYVTRWRPLPEPPEVP